MRAAAVTSTATPTTYRGRRSGRRRDARARSRSEDNITVQDFFAAFAAFAFHQRRPSVGQAPGQDDQRRTRGTRNQLSRLNAQLSTRNQRFSTFSSEPSARLERL